MRIEIQDPSLEARIKRQIEATGASSVEEALNRILQTQEEQDRWLVDNREAIKIPAPDGTPRTVPAFYVFGEGAELAVKDLKIEIAP